MIYEVEISKQAEYDLRGIYEYIAVDLQAPENAAGQLERLEKGIMSLSRMPERFRAYEKKNWLNKGFRIMPVDHYIVLYIPNREKKKVFIARVMYNGRDVRKQLAENADF